MRCNAVIYRYIFRELVPPFLINMVFLVFVFLMTTILDITDLIVNYQVGVDIVGRMILYSLPFFLQFIVPMSVMMAVLLTFLKMSADNEIVALKSGGVSLYALLPPVLAFCTLGCLVTGVMTVHGLPWGKSAIKTLGARLDTGSLTALLKERTFNDNFKDITLYAGKIDPHQNLLTDVFIEDRSSGGQVITVVSPLGRLVGDAGRRTLHLRLENGHINQVDLDAKSVHALRFDTYDVRLDLNRAFGGGKHGPKDEEEMTLAELRGYLAGAAEKNDRYYLALMEFHKKFSLPFACFALGILAVPLGITSRSAKRAFGIGLGIFFFLGYYLMLSAGWVFGEAGIYPPAVGMWMPNVITGIIGGFLLVRCAQERPIAFGLPDVLLRYAAKRPGANRRAGAHERKVPTIPASGPRPPNPEP